MTLCDMNVSYNLFSEQNLRKCIVVSLCQCNLKRLEAYCVGYEIIVMRFLWCWDIIALECRTCKRNFCKIGGQRLSVLIEIEGTIEIEMVLKGLGFKQFDSLKC